MPPTQEPGQCLSTLTLLLIVLVDGQDGNAPEVETAFQGHHEILARIFSRYDYDEV